jgi:hypothetical protein
MIQSNTVQYMQIHAKYMHIPTPLKYTYYVGI